MLRFPRIASCGGKGLIVMLGADLWLTGLSGAQSVGHSTNLRYPGKTDWRADLFSGWLTDPMMMACLVCGWQSADPLDALCISLLSCFLDSTPTFLWRGGNPFYIWSLSVDLTLYNSPHSLVQLCESMISWDCSVFLGSQCWNELYLIVSAQVP